MAKEVKVKVSGKSPKTKHVIKSLNPTTYNIKYHKDLDVEVGDLTDTTSFKPHVKMKKWDEVDFSIEHSTLLDNPPTTTGVDEGYTKLSWTDGTDTLEYYPLDSADRMEEGGFEFEYIYASKPDTTALEFDIAVKDLIFEKQLPYDQQPIHPEDTSAGIVTRTATQGLDSSGNVLLQMPDNVVNSYAVYHVNHVDKFSPQYGGGKAFHIFRPLATDSSGVEQWCDLDVDTDSSKLIVTIPQAYLDSATYPVTVDPTFGYTTLGGTDLVFNNYAIGRIASPADTSSVNSMHAGIDEWVVNNNLKMALYTTPGTFPGTGSLQSPQSEERSEGHASAQFETFNNATTGGISVTGGTNYATLVWADNTSVIRRDSGSVVNSAYFNTTYGSWPASPTLSSSLNFYSTYSTYGVPEIEDMGDEKFFPDEQNIDLDGFNFEPVQGPTGKVEIGDNATYGSANLHELSVNSWSNTQINVDMSLGTLDAGNLWMYVTNDSTETSVAYPVFVSALMPWGIIDVGDLNTSMAWCRTMGGTSEDLDNMILRSITVRIGTAHTTQARLAVYSGGNLATGPDGASLLWDAGLTAGTATDTWYTIDQLGDDIVIPKNTATWCVFKNNDSGIDINYFNESDNAGDFQTARGRYNSIAVSSDEAVAYPSTWPSDTGTFANFWYSIYLTYIIKKWGYGMRFRAGNGDYLTSSPATFAPPVNCSISFWIYRTADQAVQHRICGTGNTFEIRIDVDNLLKNDMYQGTGFLASTRQINAGTLYHCVCTIASGTNTAQIFINGELDNSGTDNDGSAPTAALEIASRPGVSEFLDGYLEDFRIYDRVLSLAEVQTMYACKGIDNITYGLIHRYLLNELPQDTRTVSATAVKDYGVNKLDMDANSVSGTGPEYTGSRIRTLRLT